jgi:amyloid beta precursor protein binding protein 1
VSYFCLGSLQIATNRCRYDRQLRLWGATGQLALENSHILLINSGPGVVGIETLKNLVLPGIGQFTIQDSAVVTAADLGVNFFLEDQHLGGFRAEHTVNLLKELNPDVEGHHITEVFMEILVGLIYCANIETACRIVACQA